MTPRSSSPFFGKLVYSISLLVLSVILASSLLSIFFSKVSCFILFPTVMGASATSKYFSMK